jgi:fibro-slime domain-containing protein
MKAFFTTYIQSAFRFAGDEFFEFFGDDDVWVFINGVLVIDLGGLESGSKCRRISLSTAFATDTRSTGYAEESLCGYPYHYAKYSFVKKDGSLYSGSHELTLEKDKWYNIDIFHADRACCGSKFGIETNMQFGVAQIEPASSNGTPGTSSTNTTNTTNTTTQGDDDCAGFEKALACFFADPLKDSGDPVWIGSVSAVGACLICAIITLILCCCVVVVLSIVLCVGGGTGVCSCCIHHKVKKKRRRSSLALEELELTKIDSDDGTNVEKTETFFEQPPLVDDSNEATLDAVAARKARRRSRRMSKAITAKADTEDAATVSINPVALARRERRRSSISMNEAAHVRNEREARERGGFGGIEVSGSKRSI